MTAAEQKLTTASSVVTAYLDVFLEKLPENVRGKVAPHVKRAAPIIGQIADVISALIPIISKIYHLLLDLWVKLQPYHPKLLAPAFCGLILCFFGGSFLTLIAAFEAYRIVGFEGTIEAINQIITDGNKAYKAFKEDDAVDENKDGIVDVLQKSPQELAMRKFLLLLRTIDPHSLERALGHLQTGFLAVIATLKLQFAKTITLGNSIAEMLMKLTDRYAVPHIEGVLPDDYKKWAKPAVDAIVRSLAISSAWFLQRVISAVHSAMRGGLMLSRNILEYLSKMEIIHIKHDETMLDEAIGYAVAAMGLYFQLSWGFSIPFPLNILLFPFSCLEYFLIYFVTK